MSEKQNTGAGDDGGDVKDIWIRAKKVQWASHRKNQDRKQGASDLMPSDITNAARMFCFVMGLATGFCLALGWVVMLSSHR